MLGKYENRRFENGEKIWIGTYRNLTNILHWHRECELIRVLFGTAEIRIGANLFLATAGECFFCSGEEMHYISSKDETKIEVMIFHADLLPKITGKFVLSTPRLNDSEAVAKASGYFKRIIEQRPRFFNEALESSATQLLLWIFNSNSLSDRPTKTLREKQILEKINSEFSTLSFRDAVLFSGYTPSHFSKLFKELTGMTFSDYLNFLKIEHAISLLQDNGGLSITEICSQCGFTTIRNFNRVFRTLTGYTPSNLPSDYKISLPINVYSKHKFDPTDGSSVLL